MLHELSLPEKAFLDVKLLERPLYIQEAQNYRFSPETGYPK
jgi:hypothetical protein